MNPIYTISPDLPPGLTFNSSNGTISGTPSAVQLAKNYAITVSYTNGTLTETATDNISIAIDRIELTLAAKEPIVTIVKNTAMTARSFVEVNGGYPPLTYSVTPNLPTGITMNAATAIVSGTPTSANYPSDYTIIVRDSLLTISSTTINLTVTPIPITVIVNKPSYKFLYGEILATSYPITATGGEGTLTYSISPALPNGILLNSNTGSISGTALDSSIATNYTILVTDGVGTQISAQFSIEVYIETLVLNTASSNLYYTKGELISSTNISKASGGVIPYKYSLSPVISGVTFDTATGNISGTPTTINTSLSTTVNSNIINNSVFGIGGGYTSVVYGNGVWVAKGWDGVSSFISYSKDFSKTWTRVDLISGVGKLMYGAGKFTLGDSQYSYDGVTWYNSVNGASITGPTAYGNGIFVVISSASGDSSASISKDGITWVGTSLPTTDGYHSWSSVVWGKDKFVAISDGDIGDGGTTTYAISKDGISWEKKTLPLQSRWSSITYGNGVFVIVSKRKTTVGVSSTCYSSDGITWNIGSGIRTTVNWSSISYGEGTFIATDYGFGGDNYLARSSNGSNWSIEYTNAHKWWSEIAYGGGVFVIVSEVGVLQKLPVNKITTIESTTKTYSITVIDDKKTSVTNNKIIVIREPVTVVTMTPNITLYSSVKTDNLFVVSASGGTNRFKSYTISPSLPTGLTFNQTTSIISGTPTVNMSKKTYTITATDTEGRVGSVDINITITDVPLSISMLNGGIFNITKKTNTYILPALVSGGKSPYTYSSSSLVPSLTMSSINGSISGITNTATNQTWDYSSYMPESATTIVTSGNNILVSVSENGRSVYSSDGKTWTRGGQLPQGGGYSCIAFGNNIFVAINRSGTCAYSSNGISWTQATTGINESFSISYGDGVFVAVNENNYSARSTDGINWSLSTMPTSDTWRVAYGNGLFVAVGHSTQYTAGSNNVAISNDMGLTWTARKIPEVAQWRSIAYGNGVFVCVAGSDTGSFTKKSAVSKDGDIWTIYNNLPTISPWESVSFINGMFIAIGAGVRTAERGTAYSMDGQIWKDLKASPWSLWYGVTGTKDYLVLVAYSGTIGLIPNISTYTVTATDSSGSSVSGNFAIIVT
jgi:hypothetical protein